MANSPYVKTIHPPIHDLDEYHDSVRKYRVECDQGENNKYAQTELTVIAEELLEQCDFLTDKLIARVNTNFQLEHFMATDLATAEKRHQETSSRKFNSQDANQSTTSDSKNWELARMLSRTQTALRKAIGLKRNDWKDTPR